MIFSKGTCWVLVLRLDVVKMVPAWYAPEITKSTAKTASFSFSVPRDFRKFSPYLNKSGLWEKKV